MNVGQAIQRICATTTNTLTPAEWEQYVSPDCPTARFARDLPRSAPTACHAQSPLRCRTGTYQTRSCFNQLAQAAGLPRLRLHDVRHSYATAGRLARVDTTALSQRVGHTSVRFTMETYMHGDLEADREVAHALAAVILAGLPGRVSPGEAV
jgi:integrase